MAANTYLRWNLKAIMDFRQIDVYQLSKVSSMSVAAINNILQSRYNTSLLILDRLSKGLDIPAHHLINQHLNVELWP